VAPRRQLAAEGYGRKGVSALPEGGDEEAARCATRADGRARCARVPGQTSSTRSRTVRLRPSGSNAMGVTMSVPTPASW
jgi:hypothetical protein